MASLNLEFTCPLCGGHKLSLPEGYSDSSVATCDSCGTEIATWGQLKAVASSAPPKAGRVRRPSRVSRRSRVRPATGNSRVARP